MAEVITVRPGEAGWSVRGSLFDNEMLFLSAERAEEAARALARKVAGSGRAAEIEIYLRDGRLAGRLACGPDGALTRSA